MTNKRIIRHPQARYDVSDIALEFVIEHENPSAGERFFDSVEETLEMLADFPHMGRKREYPKYEGIRSFQVKGFRKYLIFYKPMTNGIEVYRVYYGGRDLDALFS